MTDAELQKNRFLAMAIDVGICIALGIVFGIVGFIVAFIPGFVGGVVQLLVSIIGGLVSCGFILFRDFILQKNSVGKHLMKIRVVSAAGGAISLVQSARRNLVFAIPSVIYLLISVLTGIMRLLPGLGDIVAAITGCLTSVVALIVSLAVIGFTIWEIITITKDPAGIRWGDKFAGTQVVK